MTRDKLRNIFQSSFSYENWQSVLVSLFSGVGKNCQLSLESTPQQMPVAKEEKMDGFYIGEIRIGMESVKLYTFHIKDDRTNISRNRVGLRNTVNYLRDVNDAAIVVYYNDHQWRVSYICDIIRSLKRFSFVFGDQQTLYTTPIKRFENLSEGDISLDSILEAFSVEALSKDFFKSYKAQYDKFCNHIGNHIKSNRDYVKKMMGRLVFLQFLQKKGWMNGDYNYMQNLFAQSPYQDDFLEEVLEPLFFHVLNTKEQERNHPKLKNLGDKIHIPYLNGGLFEADENDKKKVTFDVKLFADLFDFFSHYNFTIDENDPNDAEVGIDPEMLGHIFENLLEDNNDKGAFYTPKEIVQYMCRQSLIEYLQSKLGKHEAIENFINTHETGNRLDKKNFIAANATEIERLLDEVKICDPAIGSGAFPMGMLNEIFNAKMSINIALKRAETKKRIIQNNIFGVDIEQGAVDIARLRFWLSLVVDEDEPQPLPNLDYKIMCGNSLLNRHALDISIDDVFEEYNDDNDTEVTLEDFKTAIRDYTNTSDKKKKEEFREFINNIKSAFKTTLDESKIRKRAKLEARIKDLRRPNLFGDPSKEDLQKAKELDKSLIKLTNEAEEVLNNRLYENAFEWRFEFPQLLDDDGNFVGFDIVIGNPPYLRIQGIRDTNPAFAEELVKKYKSATGSFDLYAAFAERGLQIINRGGVVNYIMPVKWTNAAFGKGLRGVVAENNSACKIINFGAYQVFNASTYTGLQWFKPDSSEMQYYELDRNLETNQELGRYLGSLNPSNGAKINADKLNKDAWVLTVGQTTEILHKLEQHPRRISDIFDRIFCGLQTSKDDVYFLYGCVEYNTTIKGYSKHLNRIIEIERGLVKPLLKGEDVHRYDNISTDRFVVFPYILGDGKANLYTEKQLFELFPLGYSYLKECEDVLRGREKGRLMNDEFWYRYIYPKNLVLFDNEKLVAPEISLGGNFAYDIKGEFYSTTKIYGYIKKENIKESYKFWLGLFNSRLFWFYLQNTGYVLRGGYFTFKTNYINPFPVPAEINPDIDDMVSNLVDMLIYLFDGSNPDILDHTANKRIRVHIEDVLNMIIYELYFGEHMKEKGIDVIADLKGYKFNNADLSKEIERFYTWYQKSENMIRQKLMLLDTRSNELIYLIHTSSAL